MAWAPVTNIKGPQGDEGPQGDQGDQGIRGTRWYTGSGAPGVIPDVIDGDLYLDTDNGDVYLYTA